MDYDDDTLIWPTLVALQQCLCEELEDRDLLPGECFCGVVPGDQTAYDYSEGMAWVRLDAAYPSTAFPTRDTDLNNCGASLAFDIEVGVLHCYPNMDNSGNPASLDQKFEATRKQMATMAAMRRAILCCQGDNLIVLNSYTPITDALLVGGSWSLTLGVEN